MDLKWGFSGQKSFFDEKLPQRHLLEHTGGCTPKQEEGLEQSNLKKGPPLSYIQKGIFAWFWPVRAGGGRCVALSAGSVPAGRSSPRPGAACATRPGTSTSTTSRRAPWWLSSRSAAPASQVRTNPSCQSPGAPH